MIIPQKMKAKLADRTDYNDRYSHYRFELIAPHKIVNEAGQYVMIEIGEGKKRAYSMCDRPDVDSSFELLVDHVGGGEGVVFLRNLKFGDEIDFTAPLGHMTVKSEPPVELSVLIATGSGISPFRSIITDQLQIKNDPGQWLLLWGMTNDEELFWLDDLGAIDRDHDNFKMVPIIFQPSPAWEGQTGMVTDFVRDYKFPAATKFYLCGNPQMIIDAKKLLAEKNVPVEMIVEEGFGSPQ